MPPKINFSKAAITKIEPLTSEAARWVQIQKIHFNDASGKPRDWEFASRTTRVPGSDCDGVGILAVLKKPSGPELLLQKQFRPPVGGVCIEVPAGLLDPGETLEQCAVRELFEETGYIGKATRSSPLMFSDPGFCNTNMKLITVDIDLDDPRNQNPQSKPEEGEFIETFTVPLKEFSETLRKLESEGFKLDARVQNVADGFDLARQYGLFLNK
ncbi:uncharacterized protein SAPINGB_P003687 [Magnusiomyces paraingens]|uniref:Nudix hydrolase domain-containing protein n=1 Tax=Magnusiomyces paraingens TaxID=2606893 RepID=A0A5E8BQQ4_9ASCO|nr:uncharacterized protein SAPINGB_P003687 [Saprochaete ingens]VVT53663.1 unnamed protein product [Saprochaete ingens]